MSTFKAVVDTNVLVSGLFWGGVPAQVYDFATQEVYQLLTSDKITQELQIVLNRPKFEKEFEAIGTSVERFLLRYKQLTINVTPVDTIPVEIRDKKDIPFVACALGGKADYLVSGDKDLLTLQRVEQTIIVSPANFLEILRSSPPSESAS